MRAGRLPNPPTDRVLAVRGPRIPHSAFRFACAPRSRARTGFPP